MVARVENRCSCGCTQFSSYNVLNDMRDEGNPEWIMSVIFACSNCKKEVTVIRYESEDNISSYCLFDGQKTG